MRETVADPGIWNKGGGLPPILSPAFPFSLLPSRPFPLPFPDFLQFSFFQPLVIGPLNPARVLGER